jgi:predicted translin family RNA/ssDNA-binding protein
MQTLPPLPPSDVLPAVAGVTIAFFALVFLGFVVLGPIGRAIADRLRGKSRERALESADQLEAIREELGALRRQVSELSERQDFAERLLSQVRERGQLNAPKER